MTDAQRCEILRRVIVEVTGTDNLDELRFIVDKAITLGTPGQMIKFCAALAQTHPEATQ